MSFRPHSLTSLKSLVLLAAAAATAALTTGCANMVTTAPDGNSLATGATMTGKLHGGVQPVGGSSIKLYAVGTGGYGSAGTLLATTTSASDGGGSFKFTQAASGTFPNTGSTYVCPASTSLLYLIASGGNTQATGSNTNAAAVFLAAIGSCGSVGSAFINVNEVTSAASVFALAQYINPGTTTPGSATIGSPNTTQAKLGLANAFNSVSLLARTSDGTAVTSFTPTTGTGATGVTVTGTPESAKLNTIANILASCVNQPTNTGNCGTLFTNAVAPAAFITSQPAATFATAVDTLQAAYYMATNPADGTTASLTNTGGTFVATNTTTNTALGNLYSISSAFAPFQPALTTQPSDWTLGITYASTGTCNGAPTVTAGTNANFFGSMESVAIDAAGTVWFNNGATTGINALGALSSTGAPTVCAFGNILAGRGLTVDSAGNVWTTSGTTGSTTAVYEYLTNGTTLNWPTANAANGITSDGSGNVYYAPSGVAAAYQKYTAASTATSTSASAAIGGTLTSSTGYLYSAIDPAGRIWTPGTSSAVFFDTYPDSGGTAVNGYTSVDAGTAGPGATVLSNDYGSAIDASNNIFGGNTCCTQTDSNSVYKVTPSATAGALTGIVSGKFVGGIVAPRSSAIDGAGNVWLGMGYPVYTAATSPTGVAIFALAEVDNFFDSISYIGPGGNTGPATCSSTGSNCPTSGGFQKATLGTVRSLAIDPSGNVWAASNGTTQNLIEFVGAAVPVVTPLSTAAGTSKLGTKP